MPGKAAPAHFLTIVELLKSQSVSKDAGAGGGGTLGAAKCNADRGMMCFQSGEYSVHFKFKMGCGNRVLQCEKANLQPVSILKFAFKYML